MEKHAYKVIREGRQNFVMIPQREYDALLDEVEDLRDVVAFDRTITEDDEGVPGDVMRRIVKGENPVRVFREYRNFKQTELAKKAGVSNTMLSEIESGKKSGSVATLKKIAVALNVDLDDLS